VASGKWSISPPASWARPEFEPGILPVWQAVLPSPHCFLHLTRFHCAWEAITPNRWEDESLLWIKLSIGSWWDLLLIVHRTNPWQQRRWQITVSEIPDKPSRNVVGIWRWDRYKTLRQFSRKKHCADTDSADSCPKAEPWEQKGLPLYTLASRLQKQKSKAQPTYDCMWLHWLFHFPSSMWPSLCFNFLSFISLLCLPFTLPHYQKTAYLILF
jgi:hypothetical protein